MFALKTNRARFARAALGAAAIAAFASASAARASHAGEEKKVPANASELQKTEPIDVMHMMDGGSFDAGDRVEVKPGKAHDPAHAGVPGTIREVQGDAYGILFDGTKQVHRWYTADELVAAGRPDSRP